MKNRETFLGNVQDVNGTTVSVLLTEESLTDFIYIDGQGYRIGQIGSFVRIPIGFFDLFGIVSQVGASSVPEGNKETDSYANRWMTIQLIGESQRNGTFQRGISQYPTLGDEIHLVSEKELHRIYGQPDKPYFVKLGHIANAESIPALVDINKLVTRHSAIVGTTGSGKSTTVASIINALSNQELYPSARILILDLHGEYGNALFDRANIFKINASSKAKFKENELQIPFWALNFDELCEVCFGEFGDEKARNIILEKIQSEKVKSLEKNPKKGVTQDSLSVDSPIPFNIHNLWHQLYIETFGTYYKGPAGRPIDNLAYELDSQGREQKGNPIQGIAPIFKNVKNDSEDKEKIHYLPNALNFGKQLLLLGSKLRIPRYDFIFKPKDLLPDKDGKVEKDLDSLLKSWIGSEKPVTILDLSGVPSDILYTTIGILLRLLYEALFWSRDLSQGGRHRPLLFVMEEAHIYLNENSKGMASKVVQRIVKEGRKYGIGAMIVSQRPSEVNATILSQCGTFFAMRLANSQDRGQITGTISDNLEGLTNMLPILRTGEAIILGEAVKLPMRTQIEPPPQSRRPDSQDPIVYDEVLESDSQVPGGWGIKMEKDPRFEEIVEVWRSQNHRISRIKEDN
ncbi:MULTISPECIES: ATP-binding protein [Leptospira]|uniref:PF01935 domain protein n=2 Tax=Leptospira borgpetersenii TaxID=174 RepID=M3FCZ4_LEPBO|nr:MULTISPECIES: ATP-binding protein [Leptospira]EKP14353.1 PF01935 domain protein [Leptospira borgpetersenii str. 200801926]EMF99732.1 PF01935 domain protein [Leptospira borgpetersenii str. 200701203]EMK12438.1 PF01935 domain protein [Leptospira sp. serovar Kenya str. Sh9]ENO64218.1 PF01935 domain protein [Leptospira borgpetersenii serovar Mini str. 201000851]